MLEHDVDPTISRLTYTLAEVGRVEGRLGADLHRPPALLCGPAGREDAGPEMLRDSDRRDRDSGARTDDQHLLAFAQPCPRGQHSPGGEKRQRESCRLNPRKALGLAVDVAGVDVEDLACGAFGVLADDAEVRAVHLLALAAPLALPVADHGVDHDLVAWLPARIARQSDDAGAIGRDDARGCDLLRATGHEEVEVVDRRRSDLDGDLARRRIRHRPLPDADSGGPDRLLEYRGRSLAYGH